MGSRVSVIIPLYNEEENVAQLHEELSRVLRRLGSHEIVYVDDGSTDGTYPLLRDIASHDVAVKVIRLRRNFGQTAALAAGTEAADGEILMFMDGDLQNDPADIPRVVELIDRGYDVVSGWRRRRRDKLLTRRIPSKIANTVISTVTGVKLHDYGCTLKAYRRDVMENIRLYGEMHRFIPAFAHWVGASMCEVEVNHRPRMAGSSKYGLSRAAKVMLDLLTVKFLSSYSTKPIYVFGAAGIAAGLAAAAATGLALWEKIVDHVYVHRNPVFSIGIFLAVLAMQFFLMGLIAELGIRTYHESQGKPIYVIRETINLPSRSAHP